MLQRIVFRVDASLQIGIGHVMRCLTLAEFLKKQGAEVEFICRAHEGNLLEYIEQQGFEAHSIPSCCEFKENSEAGSEQEKERLYGRQWLGASQSQDAEFCKPILEKIKPDSLIVDHYAIDQTWHVLLKGSYKKLMVIDDLANRRYQCDLLLDQTYGRKKKDYGDFVPQYCKLLLGSEYALLRPEFAEWRDYSLQRRIHPEFKKLLITMGGVDPDNVTGDLLKALKESDLPKEMEINVVMGATAPHLDCIKRQAELMPYKTDVKVNVHNMAELMANTDLAIGAAGATTWERCSLGLPSFMVVLAENQKEIASLLSKRSIALIIDRENMLQGVRMIGSVLERTLSGLSQNAAKIVDGRGVGRVVKVIQGLH